jgi:hypothetical protein
MAITCPNCAAEFDGTLFEFGRRVRCSCGATVEYPGADLRQGHVIAQGGAATRRNAAASENDSPALSEQRWEIWRQGDDGNPFVIQSGLTEREADELVKIFEARGHKQLYWKSITNVD